MIQVICGSCGQIQFRSPSKVCQQNFCSRECSKNFRTKLLIKVGKKNRFKSGNQRPIEWTKSQTEKVMGEKNYAWKGQKVSYRGLHAWVRRKLGKPTICSHCSKTDTRPRIIQWANVDGKYRRELSDYISLCASCHKIYDLSHNHSG
jgi:hypothetical protein